MKEQVRMGYFFQLFIFCWYEYVSKVHKHIIDCDMIDYSDIHVYYYYQEYV